MWTAAGHEQQQLFELQLHAGIDLKFNDPGKQQSERRKFDQFRDEPDAWNAVPAEHFAE